MSYLKGERRRVVREKLYDVLAEAAGRWMLTREVAREYHGRWLWEAPGDPYLSHMVVSAMLDELREQERIERRRLTPRRTQWRVLEAPPIPDAPPADWTRELVPA